MASESASSVIMLSVKPSTHITKNVAMTRVGSASDEMSVERQSSMKTRMTRIAIAPPKTIASYLVDVLADEGREVERLESLSPPGRRARPSPAAS